MASYEQEATPQLLHLIVNFFFTFRSKKQKQRREKWWDIIFTIIFEDADSNGLEI